MRERTPSPTRDAPHRSPSGCATSALPPGVRADALKWFSLEELYRGKGVGCIDGRHRDCALGAPGGDAGELVLALAVIERSLDLRLDEGTIEACLVEYAATTGAFFLHSDDEAMNRLVGAWVTTLSPSERAALASGVEQMPFGWRDLPHTLRPHLLAALAEPEGVGCGHLRAMLLHPARYRLRRGLVAGVVRSFFRAAWADTAEARFVVLEGEHDERAIVSFRAARTLSTRSLVPTLCADGQRQYFVDHSEALAPLRRVIVERLLAGPLRRFSLGLDLDEVLAAIEGEAHEQLALTAAEIAPRLAHHSVEYGCGPCER